MNERINLSKKLAFIPLSVDYILNCDDEIKKIILNNYEKEIIEINKILNFYKFGKCEKSKERFDFYTKYVKILTMEKIILNKIK